MSKVQHIQFKRQKFNFVQLRKVDIFRVNLLQVHNLYINTHFSCYNLLSLNEYRNILSVFRLLDICFAVHFILYDFSDRDSNRKCFSAEMEHQQQFVFGIIFVFFRSLRFVFPLSSSFCSVAAI